MERELQVDEDDVDFIDFHSLRRFFSVRFIEEMEEKCNLVAARLVEGVFWEEAGVVVHGWRSDGRERVIRIRNVSPEVGKETMWKVAEEWGEVLDVRRMGAGSYGSRWGQKMSGT